MRGILWHVARKLEGIFDGILMEFHMRISTKSKNRCTFPGTYPPVFAVVLLGFIVASGFSESQIDVATQRRRSESEIGVYLLIIAFVEP